MEMAPSTTFGSHTAISQPSSTCKPLLKLLYQALWLELKKNNQNGVNIQDGGFKFPVISPSEPCIFAILFFLL
jgi:hypothetical protein